MFAGFCFNNIFFIAATNFAASTVFFCPIPETGNDGDGLGATAAGFVLNSKRLVEHIL